MGFVYVCLFPVMIFRADSDANEFVLTTTDFWFWFVMSCSFLVLICPLSFCIAVVRRSCGLCAGKLVISALRCTMQSTAFTCFVYELASTGRNVELRFVSLNCSV